MVTAHQIAEHFSGNEYFPNCTSFANFAKIDRWEGDYDVYRIWHLQEFHIQGEEVTTASRDKKNCFSYLPLQVLSGRMSAAYQT